MDNRLTEYIIKNNKKHDRELKYDFMPQLLEIIEKPAHKAGTVIIVSVFSLLLVAVIWASLSKLDVVITSTGNIQPEGNLQIVQTYAGGIVNTINVKEGVHVEAGDTLLTLKTDSIDIDENQLLNQKRIIEIQQQLYKKILEGEDISVIDYSDYNEQELSYIRTITDSDMSYKNKLKSLENEKENAEINLKIAQLQLEQYKEIGSERQNQIQSAQVEQYKLNVDNADIQIKDAKTQYSQQINSYISELSEKKKDIDNNLEKYALSKEYQTIIAPVSGYVNSLNVNTIGETVASAQELVTIVPDNTPLEMLCYVKNMDISDIREGMEAEIKLDAYSYNKYGTVKGTVKYVSPSSFVSDSMGNVYLVKIELNNNNSNIELISGLSGSVEIKTDKRTVLEYFMDPIIKGFGDSMKEK
ncbi:MAG: HlyD family efflux transporter periplasmic adaptor subunit [Lachnospira sp.]|nr:HlyD family efflux transporter periplasmic adaptor subunit [Lachnospira sp.]